MPGIVVEQRPEDGGGVDHREIVAPAGRFHDRPGLELGAGLRFGIGGDVARRRSLLQSASVKGSVPVPGMAVADGGER